MKLTKLREFSGNAPDVNLIHRFLSYDMVFNLRELARVLINLQFEHNFKGWIEEIPSMAAGEEVKLVNRLGQLPLKRLVVGGTGAQIADGQAWTTEFVYLKNYGASVAQNVRILFLI